MAGAQPNIPATDGSTALWVATQNGHAEAMLLLLASGAIKACGEAGAGVEQGRAGLVVWCRQGLVLGSSRAPDNHPAPCKCSTTMAQVAVLTVWDASNQT